MSNEDITDVKVALELIAKILEDLNEGLQLIFKKLEHLEGKIDGLHRDSKDKT